MFILYLVLIFSLSLCCAMCYGVNLLGIKAAQNKQRKGHFLEIFVWFKKKQRVLKRVILAYCQGRIWIYWNCFIKKYTCSFLAPTGARVVTNNLLYWFSKLFKILPTECNFREFLADVKRISWRGGAMPCWGLLRK